MAWPIVTGIVGSIMVGLSVYSTRESCQLNSIETAAAALGYLAAWSFLKASWLATFYRAVFGKRFEGSCFKLATLTNLLLVISELATAYVGYSHGFVFPFEQLPFILVLFYVVLTLFFWLAFVSFGRGLWWDGRSIQWPR